MCAFFQEVKAKGKVRKFLGVSPFAGHRRATEEEQTDEETINAAACLRLEKIDRAAAERLIAGNSDIEQDST
jgi:hypothetical protein